MPTEVVALPCTVVATGPDATELVVAFRVSDRMTDVAIGVEESKGDVVVCVEAAWNGLSDASGGAFPYFTYASAVVDLEQPLGTRRVRAVPDGRHAPGVC